MKVSLITMHRVPNYGSVLQTYATCRVLNRLGHEVEVLDYIPDRLRLWPTIISPVRKKRKILFPLHLLYSILVNVPKLNMYKRFLQQHIPLSKKSYFSLNEIKQLPPDADVYVTGSDQVWNTFYDGFIDPVFYLDFVPSEKRRVSFAASFGRSRISQEESMVMEKYLSKYDSLSVRESSGRDILQGMGINNVAHVLDPTLLLDRQGWSHMSSEKKFDEKYILMYTVNKDEDKLIDLVKEIAHRKGLKIYYLHNGLKGLKDCDRIFRNQSPQDFLNLFANADYIIATSFHGTAFAINFNKPFISVLPEKFRARVRSILKITGLEDRMVENEFSLESSLKEIDYEKVNSILDEEREKTLAYLRNSLVEK